jgi:hypothetical protein
MAAMMVEDRKRVAARGARLQWHMIPIADIDLIARNTEGKKMGSRLKHLTLNLRWREPLKGGSGTKEDVERLART